MAEENPQPNAPQASAADAAFMEQAAATSSPENEIEKLKAEVREANDRALRSHAELENFRKRSRREMEDERRYALMPLLRDILNVVDNLDRAIEAAEKAENASSLLSGVKMVAIQLNTYLEQYNCKPIASIGVPFDPNQHEAIAQEASTEYPAGTVTRVARTGYQLHDRIVRPAQVMVSTGAPA